MTRKLLFTAAIIFTSLFFGATGASAQTDDPPKVEVGVQFSSLTVRPGGQFGWSETEPGFGGRITYNFNRNVAVEAEGNFFPGESPRTTTTGGRAFQGQFGVKAGKRFEKFGVFAKIRPGFIRFNDVLNITGVEVLEFEGERFIIPQFTTPSRTYFSTDVGGVLEFYPSRRIVTRIDIGDTIIRFGSRREFSPIFPPPAGQEIITRPAETTHNFQFSAGIGFRF
ncbi:MAG: outer membrane beta-barrel protein [Pyrinomonadaceae bacterium]